MLISISGLLIFVFLVISMIGQRGIQRTGNYENIWGCMMFGGAVLGLISFLVMMIAIIFL